MLMVVEETVMVDWEGLWSDNYTARTHVAQQAWRVTEDEEESVWEKDEAQ